MIKQTISQGQSISIQSCKKLDKAIQKLKNFSLKEKSLAQGQEDIDLLKMTLILVKSSVSDTFDSFDHYDIYF